MSNIYIKLVFEKKKNWGRWPPHILSLVGNTCLWHIGALHLRASDVGCGLPIRPILKHKPMSVTCFCNQWHCLSLNKKLGFEFYQHQNPIDVLT